jgi:hypothetical protein
MSGRQIVLKHVYRTGKGLYAKRICRPLTRAQEFLLATVPSTALRFVLGFMLSPHAGWLSTFAFGCGFARHATFEFSPVSVSSW